MTSLLADWLATAITEQAHFSWHPILLSACAALPEHYIDLLSQTDWLPGKNKIFNAFALPLSETHFILYGESPYPRTTSANGFAFWDAAVGQIWSEQGLSKAVNRATSLRNFFKMLLSIDPEARQQKNCIQKLDELFHGLHAHGFLLLNFNLSLSTLSKNQEAKCWLPFHEILLTQLTHIKKKPLPKLVLFGNIAHRVFNIPSSNAYERITAEHPYNLSFIQNESVKDFFKPFALLRRHASGVVYTARL